MLRRISYLILDCIILFFYIKENIYFTVDLANIMRVNKKIYSFTDNIVIVTMKKIAFKNTITYFNYTLIEISKNKNKNYSILHILYTEFIANSIL